MTRTALTILAGWLLLVPGPVAAQVVEYYHLDALAFDTAAGMRRGRLRPP